MSRGDWDEHEEDMGWVSAIAAVVLLAGFYTVTRVWGAIVRWHS